MRIITVSIIATLALPLFAQSPQRRPNRPIVSNRLPAAAESALRDAMEQLANDKKIYERDLAVLQHLHAAEDALADAMQPNNAIEKAFEEVQAAYALNPEFVVSQGVIKAKRELEDARRSPTSADFGHLRGTVRGDAGGPAARAVARNGAKLQEETLAWIKVQELISSHLRALSEIAADSLRAVQ